MTILAVVLAVLSLWDYPARQPRHDRLDAEMAKAEQAGDYALKVEIARRGTACFPEDHVWQYRLACALERAGDEAAAFEALERAIDLGFRDAQHIAADADFAGVKDRRRFRELVKYADDIKHNPIWLGPLASVPQTGVAGEPVMIGAHNLQWDFKYGCFKALLKLETTKPGAGNECDLYLNRDDFHSAIRVEDYPGLTKVVVDAEGRKHNGHRDFPNMAFPYPVFGNSSQAWTKGERFRSLPRALMTSEARRLRTIEHLYLANQIWVYPAALDYPPAGTNGDCFASMTPYWLITQGMSWSDKYYLGCALEVSKVLPRPTKSAAVAKGLLAPTIYSLVHRSLKAVTNATDYLSAKAFPSALPPGGLDRDRLRGMAAALQPEAIPPVVPIAVSGIPPALAPPELPECTYVTHYACAFALRSAQEQRVFFIKAGGAAAYEFKVLHGDSAAVELARVGADAVKVTLERSRIRERVDIGVFGRTEDSEFGMPSIVSFTVTERSDGGYVDPYLLGKSPNEVK